MGLNNVDGADFTLTPEGVQLNNGLVFKDGSHINVTVLDPQGNENTINMHIEGKCVELPLKPECSELKYWQATLIGTDFAPYEFIGLSPDMKANYCVKWLQVSETNYHYEDPQCSTTPPPPEPPLPPTGGGDPLMIGLMGAVVVFAGVFAMLRGRKKKEEENR